MGGKERHSDGETSIRKERRWMGGRRKGALVADEMDGWRGEGRTKE